MNNKTVLEATSCKTEHFPIACFVRQQRDSDCEVSRHGPSIPPYRLPVIVFNTGENVFFYFFKVHWSVSDVSIRPLNLITGSSLNSTRRVTLGNKSTGRFMHVHTVFHITAA